MAFSAALAERIRQRLSRSKGTTEKKMFGGIGFFLNGNMCVGVWQNSLICRLGPERGATALREPHVGEFNVTGRAMRGWVLISPDGIDSDDDLQSWLDQSSEFVATLPPK